MFCESMNKNAVPPALFNLFLTEQMTKHILTYIRYIYIIFRKVMVNPTTVRAPFFHLFPLHLLSTRDGLKAAVLRLHIHHP
jgi:hypothetical protein